MDGERASGTGGRRRSDPAAPPPEEEAVLRWAAERSAEGLPVALARADLVGFDLLNRAHGRALGDEVLVEAAERLRRVGQTMFEGEAIVARVSGPSFLLAGAGSTAELAGAVSAALAEPFGRARVGVRVGVACAPAGADAADHLRDIVRGPQSPEQDLDELAVELHRAIDGDEITVLFQPQVCVATGRILGAEALARWDHPRLGPVGAEALFAAAARAGLSTALSEHVQRLALGTAAAWPAALSSLRLSVNVTAEDVGAADFADRFMARVAAAGFPPERLTAEVTETGLIADLGAAGALLERLRAAGCRTAIDDFGTGYSSLAYLNALPLDHLKLDRALVQGVEGDGRERLVVRSVLALARSLGLATIAEGVETTEQRDLLASEGCGAWQGFLCAGAVGVGELVRLVEATR